MVSVQERYEEDVGSAEESDHENPEESGEAQADGGDHPTARDLPRINTIDAVVARLESWMEAGGFEDSGSVERTPKRGGRRRRRHRRKSFLGASLDYRSSAPEDRAFLDDGAVDPLLAQRTADRSVVPLHSAAFCAVPAGAPLLSVEEQRRHQAIMRKELEEIQHHVSGDEGRERRKSGVNLHSHRDTAMHLDEALEEELLEVISLLREEAQAAQGKSEDQQGGSAASQAQSQTPGTERMESKGASRFRIPMHLGVFLGMAAARIRRAWEDAPPAAEDEQRDVGSSASNAASGDDTGPGVASGGGSGRRNQSLDFESSDQYLGLLARVASATGLSHGRARVQVRLMRELWEAAEREQEMQRALDIVVDERAKLPQEAGTSQGAIQNVPAPLEEALCSAHAEFLEWRKGMASFRKQMFRDEADALLKMLRKAKAPVATASRSVLACCAKLADSAPARRVRSEIARAKLPHVELLLCYMQTDDGNAKANRGSEEHASGAAAAIGSGFSGSQSATQTSSSILNTPPVLTMEKASLTLHQDPVASTSKVQLFYDLLWSLLSGLLSRKRIKSIVHSQRKRTKRGGTSPTARKPKRQSSSGTPASTAAIPTETAPASASRSARRGSRAASQPADATPPVKPAEGPDKKTPCLGGSDTAVKSERERVLEAGARENPPRAVIGNVSSNNELLGGLQFSTAIPAPDAEPVEQDDPDSEVEFVGIFGPRDNSDGAWARHRRAIPSGVHKRPRESGSKDDANSPSAKRRKR